MNKNDILKEFEIKEQNLILSIELNKLKLENEKLEKEKQEANNQKYHKEGALEKALRLEKIDKKNNSNENHEGNIISFNSVLDAYIKLNIIYLILILIGTLLFFK